MTDAARNDPAATNSAETDLATKRRRALLAFVLPLAVYMVLQTLEPQPAVNEPGVADPAAELLDDPAVDGDDFSDESQSTTWLGIAMPSKYYPAVYSVKILVTLAVLIWFLPVYLQWPLKISPLAVIVGVLGGGVWIVCCWLNLEGHLVSWLGEDHRLIGWLGLGERAAYNPLDALGATVTGYAFLAVRFFGLVLLVPVIEEAFLRAFLMRFVMHDNWTEIPFGVVNRMAIAAGILVPVLYHPEKLGALVWFSLVTWLMVRTKNFWDCVAAHAITNLILGVVVLTTGWWALW